MVDLRNAPTQARSRKTLDDIMAAADRLFFARGVDGATNTEIAAEADVSIGSLYRFFPDKEALVAEYVERYMAELASHLTSPFPETPDLDDLDQIVSALLERSAIVRRTFLGFSNVRMWRNDDGDRPAQVVMDAELELVRSLFRTSVPNFSERDIELMTVVAQRSVYPVLELLPEVSKAEGAALLNETKLMISSYIRAKAEAL